MKKHKIPAYLLALVCSLFLGTLPLSLSASSDYTYTMLDDYNSKTNVSQAMVVTDTNFESYELATTGIKGSLALRLTTTKSSYAYLSLTNLNPDEHRYLVMYIHASSANVKVRLKPHMNGNSSYYFTGSDVTCYTPGGRSEALTSTSDSHITLKEGGYYYRFDLSTVPDSLDIKQVWALQLELMTSFGVTLTVDDIHTTDSAKADAPGMTAVAGRPSSWAQEEIAAANAVGLIPDDFTQEYTAAITRPQMAALLQNTLTIADAPADVYTRVSTMLSGTETMTRMDIALIIAELQELLGVESYAEAFTFTDGDAISSENKPKVDYAYEYTVIVPTNNRTFSPDAAYTVEEAIVSAYRLKNLYDQVKARYVFAVSGAYGNGMVLQRDTSSQIVGTAPADTTVTIRLFDAAGNQVYEESAATALTGKWSVTLQGQSASFEEYKLTVSDGKKLVTFTDVLFGEVWVAGGQSNMEMPIYSTAEAEEWKQEEYGLNIRIFHQDTWQANYQYTPLNSPTGQWKQANSYNDIKNCSAVAVSFAYELYRSLNNGSEDIPVGILYNAVGGTTITSWLSRYEIENTSELLEVANVRGLYISKGDWDNPSAFDTMSALYNTRVATFKGYTAAGIIYYQGEGNIGQTLGYELSKYGLEALVRCWSDVYGNGNKLPIIVSQLHNHEMWYYSTDFTDVNEGYQDALATINQNGGKGYSVAIYDLDPIWAGAQWNPSTVHPRVKRPIGERMANVALANIYGQSVAWSGPTLAGVEIQGNKLVLTFDHIGDGLKLTKSDTVRGFMIAGEDLVYYPATALITGIDTIELTCENVPNPTAATYAYNNIAFAANVAGSTGLPMVPFRTDRTPRATAYEKNDGAYYSLENQWQWCDGVTIWTTEETAQWITGSVGLVTFETDTTTKTEGDAALTVSYTASNGQAAFKPYLDSGWITPLSGYNKYLDTYHNDWLLIDVANLDSSTLKVTFFTESGSKETLVLQLHKQGTTFSTYKADLTKLSDAMRKATYDIEFVIADTNESGSITVDNIRFAQSSLEIARYTVTYVADGEIVTTVTVEHGMDATAPALPEKNGYIGMWDKESTNITANTTITAVYTKTSKSGAILVCSAIFLTICVAVVVWLVFKKKRTVVK